MAINLCKCILDVELEEKSNAVEKMALLAEYFIYSIERRRLPPSAITLPGHFEIPPIKDLEQELDLPLIRLDTPEGAAQFKRTCSNNTSLILKGSGLDETQTRDVGPFSQIVLSGFGDVIIQQGEWTSLEIKADENLLPYLTTSVDAGRLFLGIHEDICILQSESGVQYLITVQDLNLVNIIGAGTVQID